MKNFILVFMALAFLAISCVDKSEKDDQTIQREDEIEREDMVSPTEIPFKGD